MPDADYLKIRFCVADDSALGRCMCEFLPTKVWHFLVRMPIIYWLDQAFISK
jgi:hypothetical protein